MANDHPNRLISKTEKYVKDSMSSKTDKLMIAHDFKHVDRVRNWALIIAKEELFEDLELVEVTAILHDIGLICLHENTDRQEHGQLGSEIAATFLKNNSTFSDDKIKQIAEAIKYHSLGPSIIAEYLESFEARPKLLEILLDADAVDAFGAVGLMRAFTSKYYLQDYDPNQIKGNTWGLSTDEYLTKVGKGSKAATYIIDQVNQQIRYYDTLHTDAAKGIALPLIQFMKGFILQFEREVQSYQPPELNLE